MITTTFKSNTQEQMDRLMDLAAILGIETVHTATFNDEEPHIPVVGEAEPDAWLTKENGEKYTEDELVSIVNTHIQKMESHD
jgi:hypothetical protein